MPLVDPSSKASRSREVNAAPAYYHTHTNLLHYPSLSGSDEAYLMPQINH